MTKKMKILCTFIIGVLLCVGVVGSVKADVSLKELIANKVAIVLGEKLSEELGIEEEDDKIGGSVEYTDKFFNADVTIKGATELKGDITITDEDNQSEYFYEVIDFTDATITPAVFDPNALGYDDFYLEDLWIENTGKATSSIRLAVTTSTDTFISGDDVTILVGDSGASTLMKTLGNAFGADGATYNGDTATNTAFSILGYAGTDTRISNQILPILINSTTNIIVFATSSDQATGGYSMLGTGNTFDGKLHIFGRKGNR